MARLKKIQVQRVSRGRLPENGNNLDPVADAGAGKGEVLGDMLCRLAHDRVDGLGALVGRHLAGEGGRDARERGAGRDGNLLSLELGALAGILGNGGSALEKDRVGCCADRAADAPG